MPSLLSKNKDKEGGGERGRRIVLPVENPMKFKSLLWPVWTVRQAIRIRRKDRECEGGRGRPLGDTGVQLTKPTTGYKCHAPCHEQAQRSGAAEEAEAEQTKKAN